MVALAAGLTAAVLVASSASAAPTDIDISTSNLNLLLSGSIVERCTLSGGETLDLGELMPCKTAGAGFSLACNVPFDISITAANGGLAHETSPDGEGPYAGRMGYDLRVRVPTLAPSPAVLQAQFSSTDLSASRVVSSGDAVSGPGEARLDIMTRSIPEPGLLAGRYSDTITLEVTPKL